MKKCRTRGCRTPRKHKYYCGRCYIHLKRHGYTTSSPLRVPIDGECTVKGCCSPRVRRGYCLKHWNRVSRNGDADDDSRKIERNGTAKSFLDSILGTERTKCIWYPFRSTILQLNGERYDAHNYICMKAHGGKPTELHQAAHRCGNGSEAKKAGRGYCVNPNHLRWLTPRDNTLEKKVHGTNGSGEKNAMVKLTDSSVRRIHKLYAYGETTQQQLADKFGVSKSSINLIVTGKTWTHLKLKKIIHFRKSTRYRLKDFLTRKEAIRVAEQINSGEHTMRSAALKYGLPNNMVRRIMKIRPGPTTVTKGRRL